MDKQDEMSDYQRQAELRRQENKRILDQMLVDYYVEFPKEKKTDEERLRLDKLNNERPHRTNYDRSFSVHVNLKDLPRRKSLRLAHIEPPKYSDLPDKENKRLSKKRRRCYDDDDDDSDPKRRRSSAPARTSVPNIAVEDVTDSILAEISYRVSGKTYSQTDGTTCHQCRQKTLDRKSYCRSATCSGIRGMFCGVCLRNRYGEDVAVVLKDPTWKCPPCRGLCNCSICRRKSGKAPTGIMVPFVKQIGYTNIRDFLENNASDDDD